LLRLIAILLRIYTYIFVCALSVAALAFSAVILGSPHEGVRLGWLPWVAEAPGETVGACMAVLGVTGLLSVFLAASGRARFLLVLFTLAALVTATRGLFFSTWKFAGLEQAQNAFHFVLALFMAFLGSIPTPRRRRYRM
jgi:hypothetical protein